MTKRYAITIDIGTTNSKVSVYEIATGILAARTSFLTKKKSDKYGQNFDLEEIWKSLLDAMVHFVETYTGEIDSINISSVGEAGVLIDKKGNIVSPLIAWYDKRSANYIQDLTVAEKKLIYTITGLPAHTNYSLSKIKWLVDNYGLDNSETYTWLNIPDLLAFFLTGKLQTEFSMASRTMCYDLKKKQWSSRLLKMFGLEKIITFPQVGKSGDIVGYTSGCKEDILMKEHIAVRIAGHDHMVGALGINFDKQALLNSTGTTEGLLIIDDDICINNAAYEHSLSNGIYTNPDYYTLFSSMPTAGNAFAWYQKLFELDDKELDKQCEKLYKRYQNNEIKLNEKLIFIPHLNGSGAPNKSSKSKGLIYGIDLTTDREELLLHLMIGLCLELKYVASYFPLENIKKVVVIGPAIKNRLWLQLKADCLNKEVTAVKMEESVSFGALKAAYNDSAYHVDYEVISPNKQRVAIFDKMLEVYQDFYNMKRQVIKKNENI